MTKTAVLAFSGGLDTTYCAVWLREAGYAVHSVVVQTGGFDADELAAIERRARGLGVAEHVMVDARTELFTDYLRYLIFANAFRGDVYPLCVSAERVAQAKCVARYAASIGADALVHGSTGAGNDQVRFDTAFRILRAGADHPGADPRAGDFPPVRDRLARRAGRRRSAEDQQVFGQSRSLGRDDRRPRDASQRRRAAGGGVSADRAAVAATDRAAAGANPLRARSAGAAGRRAVESGRTDRATQRSGRATRRRARHARRRHDPGDQGACGLRGAPRH